MNYFQIKSYFWNDSSPSIVEIEVVQQRKIPFLQIIGAGSGARTAQRERILAALESIGERLPARKFVVQVRGEGDFPREILDLPIAIALLGSANRISQRSVEKSLFWGALSLDGRIGFHKNQLRAGELQSTWQIFGPNVAGETEKNLHQGKSFAHLRDCIQFLRTSEVERASNEAQTSQKSSEWLEFPQNSVQNSLLLHLVGGFPLYFEDFPNTELPTLWKCLTAQISVLWKQERSCEQPFHFPEIRKVKDWSSRKSLENFLQDKAQMEENPYPSTLIFNDLGRRVPTFRQIFEKFAEKKEIWNRESGILAFGSSCYCEWKKNCKCRSREIREWDSNQQILRSLFPLIWKMDRNIAKYSMLQAKEALHLAAERNLRRNYFLSVAEALSVKPWEGSALQALHYLERKREWRGVPFLSRLALTINDFRGGQRVEEADIEEALAYMSKLEISPWSGMYESRGSKPVRNSTAMP